MRHDAPNRSTLMSRLQLCSSRVLVGALALLVALVIGLSTLFYDAFAYDILAYHGPFAAVAAAIPRLSSYSMSESIINRFQGFPPLWRWAMAPGLALGAPRLLILPNVLALIAFVFSARRTLSLPWPLASATALIFPISLFGFRSAYQDFFVAALICAGALSLVAALQRRSIAIACQSVLLLWLPALTKYQGLFQAAVALILALIACIALEKRQFASWAHIWRGPLPFLVFGLLLCALQPLHNLIAHHNPFFPIGTSFFSGPEASYSAAPAYTAPLAPFHSILNHFLSASELDWVARGVVPSYTLDQARAQTQYGGILDPRALTGLVRTGGSFGPIYFVVIGAYAVAVAQAWKAWKAGHAIAAPGCAVLAGMPYLVLVAFLPQTHELRYYLALLILPAILALGWGWQHWAPRGIVLVVSAMLSISFAMNFVQPLHSTLRGLLVGQGPAYAIHYPSRDLPTAAQCLARAQPDQGSVNSRRTILRLSMPDAFACRLVLPDSYYIVEGTAP